MVNHGSRHPFFLRKVREYELAIRSINLAQPVVQALLMFKWARAQATCSYGYSIQPDGYMDEPPAVFKCCCRQCWHSIDAAPRMESQTVLPDLVEQPKSALSTQAPCMHLSDAQESTEERVRAADALS